jgi:ubiquitin-protein ligase
MAWAIVEWRYPYSEGGILKTRLSFPTEYPVLPPKMTFITPMWHPNSTCYS